MNSFLDGHSCIPDFDFQNAYMELLGYSLPHVIKTLSKRPSLNSLITLLKRCVSQKQLRHCKLSCWSMKTASSNPNAAGGSSEIGFPYNINICHQSMLPALGTLICVFQPCSKILTSSTVYDANQVFPYFCSRAQSRKVPYKQEIWKPLEQGATFIVINRNLDLFFDKKGRSL